MGLMENIEEWRRKRIRKKIDRAIQKRMPVEIRIKGGISKGIYYICVNDVPVIQEKGLQRREVD
ncbi:MAG: hypothetical protein J7K95_02485 [Thermoplasmata archaeon]|nr:hypothetical protein [Thermoplasmata archaeon]